MAHEAAVGSCFMSYMVTLRTVHAATSECMHDMSSSCLRRPPGIRSNVLAPLACHQPHLGISVLDYAMLHCLTSLLCATCVTVQRRNDDIQSHCSNVALRLDSNHHSCAGSCTTANIVVVANRSHGSKCCMIKPTSSSKDMSGNQPLSSNHRMCRQCFGYQTGRLQQRGVVAANAALANRVPVAKTGVSTNLPGASTGVANSVLEPDRRTAAKSLTCIILLSDALHLAACN